MVYHASPRKNLSQLKPQRTFSHDEFIGDFLFATADQRLAAMYLVTKGYPTLMSTDDTPAYVVICGNRDEYIKQDAGGAIYSLPADSFKLTPQLGLENYELVSRHAVTPAGKSQYKTSIHALHEVGVGVYFADKTDFDKFIKSKNKKSLLKKLLKG